MAGKKAVKTIDELSTIVQLKTNVFRDGESILIPSEDIVPGDIIKVKSGDGIPADSIIIESKNLFVNEATLTGESYPTEKSCEIIHKNTTIRERTNSIDLWRN